MKLMPSTKESIAIWDKIAKHWQGFHILHPVIQGILKLLGNVSGKKILDAGCATGNISRILAKKGAKVTAIDYSEKMLKIAQEQENPLGIKYAHGNFEKLDFLHNRTFDAVVADMVIHDLPNYKSAIKETYRILKKKGKFIFSTFHPCFVICPSGLLIIPSPNKNSIVYSKIDSYFDNVVMKQKWFFKPPYPFYYHRTLSEYFSTLWDVGFNITGFIEPKFKSQGSDKMLCYHIIIRAEK